MEKVILVNTKDEVQGSAEKLEAHKSGLLHRAISVLVFNSSGEILLQKRASGKYHSGGLWTNTCCSHPRPGESSKDAARRRLIEEMGIEAFPDFAYKFIYKTELDNQLTEHEYDHVFTVITDTKPKLDSKEASDYKYLGIDEIKEDINNNPGNYTVWFKIIMENYNLINTNETV